MSTDSNIVRAVIGLAIGVAGVAYGGVLASAAGGIVGGAVGNVGAGVIGNITHEALKDGYEAVAARLRTAAFERPPGNHDLARAIRKSHLNALQFLLNGIRIAARRDPSTYDAVMTESFCDAGDRWVGRQLKAADSRDFMSGVSLEDGMVAYYALIEQSENASASETLHKLGKQAADAAFAEFFEALKKKFDVFVPETGSFGDWFYGRAPESVGWVDAAHAFFAERLKTDSRLRSVVFLDLLNRSVLGIRDVSSTLKEVLTAIRDQRDMLSNRFDRLDEAVQTLMARKVKIDQGSLSDALFSALTRSDFPRALARRIGVEAPADSWAAFRAVHDVRDRITALSTTIFGRVEEVAALDAFIECRDRGLAVVAAPAGGGKSALLAHWLDRRRAEGDVVVRHFISGLFAGTVESIDALRHLSAQLREIDAIRSDDPVERIPYEPAELLDKLTARLSSAPPEDERLIVILDGLDELTTPLSGDIFVRASLAKGVFVVVSGRAVPNESPSYLKRWETVQLDGVPFQRFDIPGLSASEILIWLEDVIGDMDSREKDQLAVGLWKTTAGLPVFLRYVIEDMTNWLPQVQSREDRLARIAAMPSSFSEYVSKELSRLQEEMGASWTDSVRKLFALLTRTRGPIAQSEIEAMFAFCKKADSGFPPCPVLTAIDHRVGRWLSIRSDTGVRFFAFAHPRLAIAFSDALGDEAERTEEYLVSWMERAWQSNENGPGLRRGANYALDWLPEHLSTVSKHQAALLLSSPTFLQERLRDPRRAVQRLSATLDHWNRLDNHVKDAVQGSRQWTAFWAENEPALRWATEAAATAGLNTAEPALRCLGDAATSGSELAGPAPRAAIPHPPPERGLRRSIGAHSGAVEGVLPVGDRLVSWGEDGAIRFWSLDGAALTGGAADAHSGPVTSVLPVGDRLLSWGRDGAIRFWSLDGAPLPGGATHAHSGCVTGVLPVGDRLLSWSEDGSIRFWSLDGAPLPGGAADAHAGGVLGALPVADRLVSWGCDGAIRFWSLDGVALPGVAVNAHAFRITGVLPVDNRLLSWGEDGAIRFWCLDGAPLAGGTTDAHYGPVLGVLSAGDRLLSWGRGGGIRFWSLDGAPLPGVVSRSQTGAVTHVLPVRDRLLSWGWDGAIRFWSLDGAPLPGGAAKAHSSGIMGVLLIGDRLLSWGQDGAIRFWSLDGAPLTGGAVAARGGWLRGVLAVGDRLLSWGEDGVIRFRPLDRSTPLLGEATRTTIVRRVLPDSDRSRSWGGINGALLVGNRLLSWGWDGAFRFWSLDGAPKLDWVTLAHGGEVLGVLPVGDRLLSWGRDGAIRLWSLDGAPLPGGDAKAHSIAIRGVLPVGDRLVSWGYDGAIRFWSLDGAPLPGGAADAHAGAGGVKNVLLVGDRLLSWGEDGAIRFWSLDGAPLAGGNVDAHAGWLPSAYVLPVSDRLLSWGWEDGAIRFWSLHGAPLAGGDAEAHSGGVRGVLLVGDRLLSWGRDGAIRFWSLGGARLPGGAAGALPGRVSDVLLIGDRLLGWGTDGTVRFWSLDGVLVDLLVVPGGCSFVHVTAERLIALGRAFWTYKV